MFAKILKGGFGSGRKKTHYATCVTAFNKSTGNRKKAMGNVPYRDSSDFAQHITDDNNTNKKELLIPKSEFLKSVSVNEEHQGILDHPTTQFLYSPERDSHIMYDAKKDVHHFYEHP